MKKWLTPHELKEKIRRDAIAAGSRHELARQLGTYQQYISRALEEDDHVPEPLVRAYKLKKKVVYVPEDEAD